jgi:putrescine aminotransferase
MGGCLTHVFYNSSGSEANDTVFRLARHYWKLKGQPSRKIFISRWNAYHGSTVAGVSLGGMKHMHAQGDLPIAGVEHVMQPYQFGDGFGEDPAAFRDRAVRRSRTRSSRSGPRTSRPSSASRCRGRAG